MTPTATAPRALPRTDPSGSAEAAVWSRYGLRPEERSVPIDRPPATLRVLDIGTGPPVLFIHGTVGPAAWPSLIAELPGSRALVLDRPGWGGSTPVDFGAVDYRRAAADILVGALDGLGIDRARVIGGSIGNVWALALALAHPDRVERTVLLGGGPLLEDVEAPRFIRVLASPVGAAIVRLPMSAGRTRSILRDSGHGPTLDRGGIPEEFIDWRVSVSNDTPAMRHERDMVRAILRAGSFRHDLLFGEADLEAIVQPTLMVYGSGDRTGSVALWAWMMRAIPEGRLELIAGAGHMPWFDDPAGVGERVGRFLADAPAE